jgi:carbon-monoxide dehydrogenase medium subunit
MKPARFEYVPVDTVEAAVGALGSAEDARLLAGGQSLVPLMNMRLASPEVLVDINGVAGLDGVSVDGEQNEVRLGALCRHRRLERDPDVRRVVPLFAQAAAWIGHPQIRNRGTLGGSLAHGDPAAELGAALMALAGRVEVVGPHGRRTIAAEDLFVGFYTTSLEQQEIITDVVVPALAADAGTAFVEYAPRHGDFAVVGVAAHVRRQDGHCVEGRAAACGVADTVVDLSEALATLAGGDPAGDAALRAVADRVAALVEPHSDVHATADDRTELAQLLTVQAVRRAWAAASEGQDR